jgi:hypothetical protein
MVNTIQEEQNIKFYVGPKNEKKLPLNIFETSIMVVTIENLHDLNKVSSNAKILVMKLEKFDQG